MSTEMSSSSEKRHAELLRLYFERTLSDEEIAELLELWTRQPRLEDEAIRAYRTQHLFDFVATFNRRPFSVETSAGETFRFPNLDMTPAFGGGGEESWKQSQSALRGSAECQNGFDSLETTKVSEWVDMMMPRFDRPAMTEIDDRLDEKKVKTGFHSEKKGDASPYGFFSYMKGSLLIGILILFGLGVYHEFRPPVSEPPGSARPFHPNARISACIDVQGPSNVSTFRKGRQLKSDRICFDRGIMELTFQTGVRVVLEGPVDFQVKSQRQTFCRYGKVSAEVPPQGHGFEIATPLMNVVDLGTEFFLDVGENEAAVHVLTGNVLLNHISEETQHLSDGRAFQIDVRGNSKQFDADRTFFWSMDRLRQKVERQEEERYQTWRQENERWNNDPDLLIHYDFDRGESTLSNRAKRGLGTSGEGRPMRTSAAQGRWLGKDALRIKGPKSHIEIPVRLKLKSLTLSASVKIDSLNRFNQALFSSVFEGNRFVWQFQNNGSLQLSMSAGEGFRPAQFNSPSVLSVEQWDCWHSVALVVDASRRSVLHYFNGKEVASLPWEDDAVPVLENPQIGNIVSKTRRITDCSLGGGIDQFYLFKRALSAEEIRRLHAFND